MQYGRVDIPNCWALADEEGVPWVAAGFPYLKLWPDSAHELGEEMGSMRPVRPGIERLAQPLGDHFCPEPSRLTHVYLLGTTNTSEVLLLPLKGSDSLKGLVLHTYSQRLLDGLGDRGRHFRQCSALAEHARVSEVKRPAWPFLIEGLVDRLERDFTR